MTTIIKLTLPLLCIYTIYALFIFSERNGLFPLIREAIESRTLPTGGNGTVSLRTIFTGNKPLDHGLASIAPFFWPAIDGSTPELSLYALVVAGSFGAAWVLVTMEGWRMGNVNGGRVVAFPSIFGILAQTGSYALTSPLYCALHIWTSSIAAKPDARKINVPRAVSNALPFIFVVGYILPTVAMCLPAPSIISFDTKQAFHAAWQPCPLYISFLATGANLLFSRLFTTRDNDDDGQAGLRALRRVYAFAFACATIPHVAAWMISLASVMFPVLFNTGLVAHLHPQRVFVNALPWSGLRVSTIGEGALRFLQWDNVIGSTGILLWAVAMYATAHREVGIKLSWIKLGVKIGLLALVSGPVGAAVGLMWERDEVIFSKEGLKQQKEVEKKTN
ncbi:hypothetical protein VTN00DRAFT_5093 [Thermoascus crustaceus]|uniref:uncharacterized protein n=1 Tax=Thermoascus crustaceus TaxID=5088 RepID=UPI0037440F5D